MFRVRNTEDEFCVTPMRCNEAATNETQINLEINDSGIKLRRKCYEVFDNFFHEFSHEILSMGLTIKEKDTFFSLCSELVKQHQSLMMNLLQEKDQVENYLTAIHDCTSYVCDKIQKYETSGRRLAEIKSNHLYVKNETRIIGLKWKTETHPHQEIPDHNLVQCGYQYVSPIKTLTALFSDPKFREKYMNYNHREKHNCKDGVYADFCCGSSFKNNKLFATNPDALQIELSSDDFEVCSPLKSKAGVHKLCAVYFRIRNMPPQLNSKLDSVYLVALCPSAYLKQNERSFQEIAQEIVQDLKILETSGIEISPGQFLRGTLTNTSHDNLGGNSILGFVECFVATNSCRQCECTKDEIQNVFVEDPSKMRRKEEYEDAIMQIDDDSSKVLNIKGVKMYCVLNNLEFYHMLENRSVDLMHDVNEGTNSFE